MASRAQCERLRDRYIDLQLSSSVAARTMTSEARASLRGQLALEVLSSPFAAKLDSRCPREVSETAYRCAAGANTIAAWEQCVR
jgi:hypothetical protein